MVALHDMGLNGILADEMVCTEGPNCLGHFVVSCHPCAISSSGLCASSSAPHYSCPAGPRQDDPGHRPAGISGRVQGRLWSFPGGRPRLSPAQLGGGVPRMGARAAPDRVQRERQRARQHPHQQGTPWLCVNTRAPEACRPASELRARCLSLCMTNDQTHTALAIHIMCGTH